MDDWATKYSLEAALLARTIPELEAQEIEEAIRGVSEAVAAAWARGRPLPRAPEELPIALIAERFCPGEEGLVRWVAGVLLRRGELPLVGRLDAPDIEGLAKWKGMFDWGC